MAGSEGKQNDRMSAKEIETEEMAQELMNMAMYEEGMGYEQMKEILQVINESKHMAGIKPDNRSSQEIIEYLPEITISKIPGRSNSMRDILDDNSIPKPSFSYRQASGRASPAPSGRRSVLEGVVDEEMSPASPELFTMKEPKRLNTERELISDGLSQTEPVDQEEPRRARSKNDWPSLPGSSPNALHSDNSEKDKSAKNQRVERWRIDPLETVVDDNDALLQHRERPTLEERVPYSFCHKKRALEEPRVGEKVIAVLTYALEEAVDIWERNRRPEVSEFQWGLPIKVDSNSRNSDKKTVKEADSSPHRPTITRINPDSAQRRNMDRNCKRKAVDHMKNLLNNQIESDESDEDIFERTKKPKVTDTVWEPSSKSNVNNREKTMTRQEKLFSNTNAANATDPLMVDEYDSDDFDNDNLRSLRLKSKKKVIETSRPSSPQFVPRRIVPPNPSKPRAARKPQKKNGEKAKRKSPVRNNTQATFTQLPVSKGRGKNSAAKRTVMLTDDEIMSELEVDTSEEKEVEMEIKPKPVKGLAARLLLGTSKLVEAKNAEEKLEISKKEEQQRIEQKEEMRKQQLAIDRYLKDCEDKKEREAKEAQLKAKEETYRKQEVIRDRDRRRRQAQEKRGMLLMDDDDDVNERIIHNIDDEQVIGCPICGLEFSQQEIQDHAADCNQFDDTDVPGPSRSPVLDDDVAITNEDTIHDCVLCEKFTTSNPIAFEEHVNACSKLHRNGIGSPSQEIIEIPTSPIRCFVPISEQTESTINYAEQFPNRIVNVNITRRKRKG